MRHFIRLRMASFMEEKNFLQMPLVITEMIVNYLRPKDIIALSKTCKFLQNVCTNPKFWRKLIVKVTDLVSKTNNCEFIVKEFSEKGLIDFEIYYPRNESGIKNLAFGEVDNCANKVLKLLPNDLEKLQIPLFMFSNAMNLLSSLERFTNLKSLTMGQHIQLFGEFKNWKRKYESIIKMLNILFTKIQKLEHVVIHDCHGFLKEPFSRLARNNPQLKSLDASYSWSLDRSGLTDISCFVGLQSLTLRCCGINDEDLVDVLDNCQKLEHLDISWTFVTSITLAKIPEKLPILLYLNLSGCKAISYSGLRQFSLAVSSIKKFYIRKAFTIHMACLFATYSVYLDK